MDDPLPPPPPAPGYAPAEGRGSLLGGFGTGCAVLAIGPLLSWLLIAVFLGVTGGGNSPVASAIAALAGLIPIALLVGAVVYFLRQGHTRSALGVLAAVLASIALALLLVAACFGLFAASGH